MLEALEKLANIVYPPRCIFCQDLMNANSLIHICSVCYKKLSFAADTILATSQEPCNNSCDGAICLFHYKGLVRESLTRFKFHNKPGYYRTYARLMVLKLSKLTDINSFDVVMGIPLHGKREFARGYNQAFLISKALSRELNIKESSHLVKRLKNTDAQSLLDKQKRHANIKNAFKAVKPEAIKGRSVLLVDDIMTTGSTLEECGRILKEAGARKVTAIVAATGRNCY